MKTKTRYCLVRDSGCYYLAPAAKRQQAIAYFARVSAWHMRDMKGKAPQEPPWLNPLDSLALLTFGNPSEQAE